MLWEGTALSMALSPGLSCSRKNMDLGPIWCVCVWLCLQSLGMSLPPLGFSLSISVSGWLALLPTIRSWDRQPAPCFPHLSPGPHLAGKETPFEVGWRRCPNGASFEISRLPGAITQPLGRCMEMPRGSGGRASMSVSFVRSTKEMREKSCLG